VLLVVVLALVDCANTQASHLLSRTLGNSMVLQRAPYRASLWGWTKSGGENVVVKFDGSQYSTTSSSTGFWRLQLPPVSPGGPFIIQVQAVPSGETVTLTDVLFGDVFFCGGQSNMQMTLSTVFNASQEIARAQNYPHIRLFTVGQGTTSKVPLPDLATILQSWSVANPKTVGGPDWQYFSALCWLFGRELYDKFRVPIGLVSSNWGGTIVEAWSSPDALSKCPRMQTENSSQPISSHLPFNVIRAPDVDPNEPSVLWNAMVVPYLNMAIRGAIWYQGESNALLPKRYACTFPAMIQDWRAKWGQTAQQYVFLFVQLAAYTQAAPPEPLLAETRAAQAEALKLPYVGMGTAVDLGDISSPYGNIHPRDKQHIGYRLGLAAEALSYNSKVLYTGPTPDRMQILVQPPTAVVRVHFKDALGQGQLVIKSAQCPALVPTINCAWFDIATSDGRFHNATEVRLGQDRTYVELRATIHPPAIHITGARYGWADWPVCILYNAADIPAPPFSINH